jgi:hypothetical protein
VIIVPADPNVVIVSLPPDILATVQARAAKKKQPTMTVQEYIVKAVTAYLK